MAFYISICKLSESPTTAEYAFGSEEAPDGRLSIEKATGEITLLESADGDSESSLFQRAARKVWLHWQSGHLPDRTCWAS